MTTLSHTKLNSGRLYEVEAAVLSEIDKLQVNTKILFIGKNIEYLSGVVGLTEQDLIDTSLNKYISINEQLLNKDYRYKLIVIDESTDTVYDNRSKFKLDIENLLADGGVFISINDNRNKSLSLPYILLKRTYIKDKQKEYTLNIFKKLNGQQSDYTQNTKKTTEKISVIISSFNYGHFLPEAIESVLNQTCLPDEILLSDDASEDNSGEIMKLYASRYPDLIKVNINKVNMGIENHFNKAINLTSGEYICFLGADNRIPINYIERLSSALVEASGLAVVYTDFALFGNRAKSVYDSFTDFKGEDLGYGVYTIIFPEFNSKSRRILDGPGNFIHGSSMYKREAFNQVGGYKSRADGAEDKKLFKEMIDAGWGAKKVDGVYLEYRQHSQEQANLQFAYFTELNLLRSSQDDYVEKLRVMKLRLNKADTELFAIKQSKSWKIICGFKKIKKIITRKIGL